MPSAEVPVPVPHLCPSITKLARLFRQSTKAGDPLRKTALALLREVQDGVHQLRWNDAFRQEQLLRSRTTVAEPVPKECVSQECPTHESGARKVVQFLVAEGTQEGIPEKHRVEPGLWLICLGCGTSWKREQDA